MSMAQQLKEQGNQCFKEKRYNKAILHYTSSLEKELDHIVLGNRAQCYINLKIFDNALMDCNRALELNPNYIKGLFRRAIALEAMGLTTAAKQDIERLLKLSDDNAAKSVLDRLVKKHDSPCIAVSVCEKGDEIRSSVPLQNITIDCDHVEPLEEGVSSPSNKNDTPSLDNLSLCKSPISYSDVVVDFSLLRNNPSLFALYFMKISPELYHRLFDDVLDVEVISCLLKGLSQEITNRNPHIDPKAVCNSLLLLSEVRRFDMLIMFLFAEDKKNLPTVCEHLPKVEAQLILAKYLL